jgi:Zn-dependent peptidase ImmA (M78 family)
MPGPKADREADKILDEFGVVTPPIPVEQLARKLGARLVFEPLGADVSGMLYRAEGNAVIGVNSHHAKTRQRFTIAHEIGHLRLHPGKPMFVDRSVRIDKRDAVASLGVDRDEIEANSFAAALLMPESMIVDMIKQWPTHRGTEVGSDVIARLAHRFEVSQQAMELRLANLGLSMPDE